MKLTKFSLLALISLSIAAMVSAQQGTSRLQISADQFESYFRLEGFLPHSTGVIIKNSNQFQIPTIFSLNTPSEYRVRRHRTFHEITERWSVERPDSRVVVVHYNAVYPNTDTSYARNGYVLVIWKDQILNIELVRRGACTSRTMLLHEDDEKDILIDAQIYSEFKKRIIEAEISAKHEGIGIWSALE
jgi:hypothetical protein